MENQEKTKELPRWAVMMGIMSKIGLFTFGGGWSIIAQMQTEFVEKREWLTAQELVDMVSIARSMPGIMIINVAVMFGYHVGGPAYAVLCALALAFPAFAVMVLVTLGYTAVRDNPYIIKAMTGVRAAVVPIILTASLKLRKTAIVDWVGWAIVAAACGLFLFTSMNNIYIVLLGGVAGLTIQSMRARKESEKKEDTDHGAC